MADDKTPSAQVILANERTLLAWIRTSLALVVTGVALEAFDVPIQETWRRASATIFVLLGIAAAVQAWVGWRATDSAARAGKAVPAPALRHVLVAGVIAAVVIVGVGLLVGA
ncbi:YidH family protein [Demequina sp.]|uniref:YidH family protein n=1 Tax=Demequina sp. TaxID=2050685 RepID=UPI003D13A7F3